MHNNLIMRIQKEDNIHDPKTGFFHICTCFPYIPGVELDSSQYVTTFNENGIRTQTKLNSTDAVATVSPFRTSRASNRTSSLTGQVCDAETQRLRRELQQEQERVQRLSAQLSTNVRSLIRGKWVILNTGTSKNFVACYIEKRSTAISNLTSKTAISTVKWGQTGSPVGWGGGAHWSLSP